MRRLLVLLNARFAYQRGRTLLSMAGIALGVALGFGVHLVNRAAVDELAAAVRAVAGEADLEIRGGRAGFPDAVHAVVARVAGVTVASPGLDISAGLGKAPVAGKKKGASEIRILGLDSLRAGLIQPTLFGTDPALRLALLAPDTVLISAAAQDALGLDKGDVLPLVVGPEQRTLKIVGVLPGGALRGVAAITDIATAQWRLDRLGVLNRIDVRLAPGADPARVRARISAVLPPGATVRAPDEAARASADPSRAYRVNLNVLALVALFTGGFLVFSAQSLEMTRRRGEHALLRALGLERSGVRRLVLLEAAALGVLGSSLGLALGYGFARVAIHIAGADLGAGMFRGFAPQVSFPPLAALVYAALGTTIAVAGALLPALDAAARPPARALRAGDEQTLFARTTRGWPGTLLLLAGAAAAFAPSMGGVPVFGYLSIACLLIGAIALMPSLLQSRCLRWPQPRHPVVALAAAQLRGAPGQAMISLAAVVTSFSLMVAMAIMVASFRQSVDDWLAQVLPADLYLRTSHAGETGFLDPSFERAVRASPLFVRVGFQRSTRVTLDGQENAVSLIARDTASGAPPLPRVGADALFRAGDPPPIWVSEAVADLQGWRRGMRVAMPVGGSQRVFTVAGVWRDYARQHGAVLMRRDDYRAMTGDHRANDAALWHAPGVTQSQAMQALRTLPGGATLEIAAPGDIRALSLAVFDRSFAVTYAIEAVAVLVGLFGLSSSLGAVVLSRRREFGVLRHLGMTRRQIGALLATEGALLAALGAAVGLLVGGAISLVLIHVVNRQSFHWSMDLHPPWHGLSALALALIALAALTAWWSGREATGPGPVAAVREDW